MDSVPVDTAFQRLVVEHALALAREVELTAGAAPHGRVLDRCEGLLLTRGRDFLLTVLQGMAQQTADETVKKGGAPASAATASATKAKPRARS
jgi:hypothetical protein